MNVLVEFVLDGLVGDDGVLGLILDCIEFNPLQRPIPIDLKKARRCEIFYPFPWTTSSSASFHLALLRGPDFPSLACLPGRKSNGAREGREEGRKEGSEGLVSLP